MMKSIRMSKNLKILLAMLIFHTALFFTLLLLALFIFQSDIYHSLWSAGILCTYCNDSWRFIANSLNPTHPPYPYHPIATSLHHHVLYKIISVIIPSTPAITLSVLIVQFSASFLTLFLMYYLFLESFHLDTRLGLVLIAFYDFIFISPYLLLASSEILFLFYQVLAWTCFVRRQYFFAALATAMTFAIRFNGAFFLIGMILVFFLKWWKTKDISLRLLINLGLIGILMFIVGFSSFILSWFFRGDFWLPLTAQTIKYQSIFGYVENSPLSVPFLWWITYFQWVLLSNLSFELLYLIMGVFSLGLGFLSLYTLLKWSKKENREFQYPLTLIFICGFLGTNIVISGSNFARFLSITFPVFPVFPLWLRDHTPSSLQRYLLLVGAGIWGLLFNIIWWMTY